MYTKNYIEPSRKLEDGLEEKTHDYYANRKREKLGYIGPIIRGMDVGVARYADLHLDYETRDLTATKIVYEDYDFNGYKVRHFHPEQLTDSPITVFYIHGGGYITGTIERYNHMNSLLADLIQGNVFHVDYTPSPETGYPTALQQSYHAIEYVVKETEFFHVDPEKIAVMGDSAGGNICAVLPLMDRENHYIKYDIPYYPRVDMSDDSLKGFDLRYFGEDLTPMVESRVKSLMDLSGCRNVYLQNGEDVYDELISPLYAKDLNGYPETLMFTAEYDFLTLQSEAFADKLDEAGIKVDYYKFIGTFHGYLDRVGYFEASEKSLQIVKDHLFTRFNH